MTIKTEAIGTTEHFAGGELELDGSSSLDATNLAQFCFSLDTTNTDIAAKTSLAGGNLAIGSTELSGPVSLAELCFSYDTSSIDVAPLKVISVALLSSEKKHTPGEVLAEITGPYKDEGLVRVGGKPTVETVVAALMAKNYPDLVDPDNIHPTTFEKIVRDQISNMELVGGRLCWRQAKLDGSRTVGPQPTLDNGSFDSDHQAAGAIFAMIAREEVIVGHEMSIDNPSSEAVMDRLLALYDPDYDPESILPTQLGSLISSVKLEMNKSEDGNFLVRMEADFANQGGLTGGGLATSDPDAFDADVMKARATILDALRIGIVVRPKNNSDVISQDR